MHSRSGRLEETTSPPSPPGPRRPSSGATTCRLVSPPGSTNPGRWLLVGVDGSDRPIALCHALMLSDHEGWLEAARVHPEHRRTGLGSALNRAGVDWLAGRGARVVRLAIESVNRSARSQVEKLGYRPVSHWHHGRLQVDPTRRAPARHRLRAAPPTEIDAAWMFWSGGELAVAGRELLAQGWQWRKTRPYDLASAASEGRLYQSPAGWMIVDQPESDWLRSGWLATDPEDAPPLFQGLLDLGVGLEAEEITVMVPGTPWVVEALTRAGGQPTEIVVYAKTPQPASAE
ncbi:MAG: GNAT family N-acetyltransferase [Acidimicrobiia bacterium]